eukprot:252371-Pyramimonas_sp.AAC.1
MITSMNRPPCGEAFYLVIRSGNASKRRPANAIMTADVSMIDANDSRKSDITRCVHCDGSVTMVADRVISLCFSCLNRTANKIYLKRATEAETGCSERERFLIELEFIQSLANPRYIN